MSVLAVSYGVFLTPENMDILADLQTRVTALEA